jgi:hypothetical protein
MTLDRIPTGTLHSSTSAPEVETEIEIGYFKGSELIDFKWVSPTQFGQEIEKAKNSSIIIARIKWDESSDNPNNYTS